MKSGTFRCRNSISVRQQVRFLRLKTFSWRSCRAMWRTELRDIPVSFSISFGLSPCSPWIIFLAADEIGYEVNVGLCPDRARWPLLCLRDTDDHVWSIFRSNILTAVRDHCLFGNSHKIILAPHPFSSCKSFIAALSSFVNRERHFLCLRLAHWSRHCWRHCVFP